MHNNPDELMYWFMLAHRAYLDGAKTRRLLAHFGSPRAICHANYRELSFHGLSDTQINQLKSTDNQLDDQIIKTKQWLENTVHHVITIDHPAYPSQLAHIPSAPALFYVMGNLKALCYPQIAMVGSRHPSPSGLSLAKEFAYQLSVNGLCITSGLALGIDGAAHEGALEARGSTIAVLGTGLKNIYPKRHSALAELIIQSGCIISELPLYAPAIPENFPRRNRLISGLGVGTFVVEAAIKSGSLITARYALEQGRDVFALPGSVRNATAKGCLQLIQQGAKCVISVDDILQEINGIRQLSIFEEEIPRNTPIESTLDPIEQQVLACIENDATTIDQICDHSKLSAQMVMVSLSALELRGYIKPCQLGYVRVIS